jgi:hypothetical protein
MKIIAFKYQGVAGLSKKVSLKILMESHQSNILLLQETMGDSGTMNSLLKNIFP